MSKVSTEQPSQNRLEASPSVSVELGHAVSKGLKSQCLEGMQPQKAVPACTKHKGRRRRSGASLFRCIRSPNDVFRNQILHEASYLLLRAWRPHPLHDAWIPCMMHGDIIPWAAALVSWGRWGSCRTGGTAGAREPLLGLCLVCGQGQRKRGEGSVWTWKVPVGGGLRRTRQGCRAVQGPVQKWQ